jgi:hypothetical protein
MKITLVLLTVMLVHAAASAQARYGPPKIPWGVWVGAGTDGDALSLSIGAKRELFGLGAAYVHNFSLDLPDYSTATPPSSATKDFSFQLNSVGLDLYSYLNISDWLAGYGSIGGYMDINTVLVQDSFDGKFYRSSKSPDWTNAHIAYGFGVEATFFEKLLAGIGYHTEQGFNARLGYTW